MFDYLPSWLKSIRELGKPHRKPVRLLYRPILEELESRIAPVVRWVNLEGANPAAQLQQRILISKAGDTIGFYNTVISSSIAIDTSLAPIVNGITIDGHLDLVNGKATERPGRYITLFYAGGNPFADVNGLTINNKTDIPVTIKGLAIDGFPQSGIYITGGIDPAFVVR
jgi:hypothetical protein